MSFTSTVANSIGESDRSEPIRRCEALWFEDGSIVIQAQSTQFRVHRSVLSTHSKIFRDMFSVPQPEGEVIIEGCPVVHMADKSDDWENVLNLLYHGLNMHQSLNEYPIPILISMLRIGHKHQFDTIKNAAYGRLESELPTQFTDWNDSQLSVAQADIDEESDHFTKGHEVDLINIAIEIEMRRFLPVLYYIFLKDLSLTEIFDGTTRSDGTVAHLSQETQRLLVLARDDIFEGNRDHSLIWLFGCDTVDNCDCAGYRADILEEIKSSLAHDISLALQDPPDSTTAGLCNRCIGVAKKEMLAGREQLWNNLPSYFDLPQRDLLLQEE